MVTEAEHGMNPMAKRAATFLRLVRWDEWFDSKLPLIAACALSLALQAQLPWCTNLLRVWQAIGFACLYLAYGYLLNDYCDRASDRRAGKIKEIYHLPDSVILGFLVGLVLAGGLVLLPESAGSPSRFGAALMCYVLGTAYSAPPLRLKERGVLGLLGAAIAQRSLPVVVTGTLWNQLGPEVWAWVILSTMVGIRYILIHQYLDRAADVVSQVETFAVRRPRAVLRLLITCFMLEIVAILALTIQVGVHSPAFQYFIGAYGLYAVVYAMLYCQWVGPLSLTTYAHVPLEDLYHLFLPLWLYAMLCMVAWPWLVCLPLVIVWLRRRARQYLVLPLQVVKSHWKRPWTIFERRP